MSHSKLGSTMGASSIFSQTPRSRYRQKRRCVFFQSPRSGDKSRHGAPVLSIQKTALINNRLSAEGRPTQTLEPGRSFSIFAHTLSEISCLRCTVIWSLLIVSEEIATYSLIWRHYLGENLQLHVYAEREQRVDTLHLGAVSTSHFIILEKVWVSVKVKEWVKPKC